MQKNKLNIFKDKKVFITGHTGFKGSWLSIWLNKLGAKVIGFSKDIPTYPSLFSTCKISNFITDYRSDILNTIKLKSAIHSHNPDFIFHLAAQPLVKYSYKEPLSTIQTNTIGTINLLEILKDYQEKVDVVFITSDKVYDNVEWVWGYKETDRLGGKDPYSASKAMAEIAIRSYFYSFIKEKKNIKIAIGRAGNVIGGGDWSANRIVPDSIKKWTMDEIVSIRNPHSTRPWQHVLEPLSGYLQLAYELNKSDNINGEAFNFGPQDNSNYSVISLIDKMRTYWPKDVNYKIIESESSFKEAGLLKLNCDKSSALLRWRPRLNFEECVKMTIEWYEKFYAERSDILEFTELQISNYQSKSFL